MMLPREKLQVGCAVLGLSLVGFGIALVQPGARSEESQIPQRAQGVGFWKDHTLDVATGRKVGPWMIGGGVAAVGLAYMLRPR